VSSTLKKEAKEKMGTKRPYFVTKILFGDIIYPEVIFKLN